MVLGLCITQVSFTAYWISGFQASIPYLSSCLLCSVVSHYYYLINSENKDLAGTTGLEVSFSAGE